MVKLLGSLQERAFEKYHAYQVQLAAEEQEATRLQSEGTSKEFAYKFGVKPDWANGLQAGCDGLIFWRLTDSYGTRWLVEGYCPRCGREVSSNPIDNLVDLGELLQDFRPGHGHVCPTGWRGLLVLAKKVLGLSKKGVKYVQRKTV